MAPLLAEDPNWSFSKSKQHLKPNRCLMAYIFISRFPEVRTYMLSLVYKDTWAVVPAIATEVSEWSARPVAQ